MSAEEQFLHSEQILNAICDSRQEETVVVDEERVKVVVFTLSGQTFAFHGNNIREILPPGSITWVPGLPEYIPGLINVRGDIESVLDIRSWLGLAADKKESMFIAMAQAGEVRSGIMVDVIQDVVDVLRSEIRPPLSTLEPSLALLVAGEMQYQGSCALILDVNKLFSKITAS